jgi:hypothetical protein
VELYDHITDPVEAENIAARSENDALVKELTAKLTAGCARPRLNPRNRFILNHSITQEIHPDGCGTDRAGPGR